MGVYNALITFSLSPKSICRILKPYFGRRDYTSEPNCRNWVSPNNCEDIPTSMTSCFVFFFFFIAF